MKAASALIDRLLVSYSRLLADSEHYEHQPSAPLFAIPASEEGDSWKSQGVDLFPYDKI
jgi:hypothetical protein